MKHLRLAAAALAVVIPFTAQAQTMKHGWPPVDHWVTMLVDGGQRGLMCSTASVTSSGNTMSIITTRSATHLYLNYGRTALPLPRNVVISADGEEVFQAPILADDVGPAGHFVQADLPGSVLADTIAPALEKSNSLELDLGDRRFTASTRHFSQVVKQMIECAGAAENSSR
jgi:hypothetical protein